MADCLSPNEFPDVLQEAAQRRPRKSSRAAKSGTGDASRQPLPTTQNHPNNYLAEASAMRAESPPSPLGGRNRKGAGAPIANHNARCRAYRRHIHLKKRLLAERLQLLALSAAVAHLERRFASPNLARALLGKQKISSNNYLAEAAAMRPDRRPDQRNNTHTASP